MHCPSCGSQASEKQKFCRACGLNLEGLAERVALHQGTMSAAKSRFDSFFIRLGTLMAIGGGGVLMLLVLFFFINAVFDFFSNSTIDDIVTKVAVAIGLPLLFFGIGFVVLPHLLRLWKPNRPLSLQAVTTAELVETPILSPVSSVTEQTTRNLEPLLQQRPTQHE